MAPAHSGRLEGNSSGQQILLDHNDAAADMPVQPDLNLPEAVLHDMMETICADLPAQETPPKDVPVAELQQGQHCATGLTAPHVGQSTACGGSLVPDRNLAGGQKMAELLQPCWDAPTCAAPTPDADAHAEADAGMEDDMDADMDTEIDSGAELRGSPSHPLETVGDLPRLPSAVPAEMFREEMLGGNLPVGTQLAASFATDQHAAEALQSNAGGANPGRSVPVAASSVGAAHAHAVGVQDVRESAACMEARDLSLAGNTLSGVPQIALQPLPERPARTAVAFQLGTVRRPVKNCVQDFEHMVARGTEKCSEKADEAFALPTLPPSEEVIAVEGIGVQGCEALASRDADTSELVDDHAAPESRQACGLDAPHLAAHGSTIEASVETGGCRNAPGSRQQSPEPAAVPIEEASLQVPAMQNIGVPGPEVEAPRDELEFGEEAAMPQASSTMRPSVEFGPENRGNRNQQNDGLRFTELTLAGWVRSTEPLQTCAAHEDPSGGHESAGSQEQEPMHLNTCDEPGAEEINLGSTLVSVPGVSQVSKGVQRDSDTDKVMTRQEVASKPDTCSQLPAVRPTQQMKGHERSSQLPAEHAGQYVTSDIALLQQYVSHSATSATKSTEQASLSEQGDGASAFAALQENASDSVSTESAKEQGEISPARIEVQSKQRDEGLLLPHLPGMSDSMQVLPHQTKPCKAGPASRLFSHGNSVRLDVFGACSRDGIAAEVSRPPQPSDTTPVESQRSGLQISAHPHCYDAVAQKTYPPFEPGQSQSPESSLHIELNLNDGEIESRDAETHSHQSKPGSLKRKCTSDNLCLRLDLSASEAAAKEGSVKPLEQLVSRENVGEPAQAHTVDGSSIDQDDRVMEHHQECSGQNSPTVLLRDLASTAARLKEPVMQLDALKEPARQRHKQMMHDIIACFVEHLNAAKRAPERIPELE